ncbi:hypothetical protein KIN20_009920 [Parelaphostrongylus tenuis]|uniref:Neuralized n=1 Tax=Parelaphostrongylus tenuis TaxID=148309 RepID=A0AAD5M8U5_PARTN|nr:hypothetical protein KIN20_009920 [Parelaphostrongylus tenuis]
MGNVHGSSTNMVDSLSGLAGFTVNQGTQDSRLPQLAFHSVHGQNVVLLSGGRVARRKESFCKGLAFSNRPISVNENVCIRLTEVSTSWSGVLRFGVTNVDPETYRNIQVPKFACPDLTSKEGFWAKALPERYSVEGNILHFSITHTGDLYYGVNGVHKGVFLMGINVSLPIWIIVDIYGNSVAIEFVDPADFIVPRASATVVPRSTSTANNPSHEPVSVDSPATVHQQQLHVTTTGTSSGFECLRFHQMTGRHVSLNAMRNIATRCDSEYSQGYVFSERPIRNNEKVVIEVVSVQQLYIGGLAFGVTCCDPSTLRPADLPDNSSDLVEMPQYWVSIKDIALQPPVNTVLSFWITDAGTFNELSRFLDLILHCQEFIASASAPTRVALPPLPTMIRREPSALPSRTSQSYEFSSNALRVLLRDDPSGTSSSTSALDDDNVGGGNVPAQLPALPPRRSAEENPPRTVDDLLSQPPALSCPPPIAPRTTPLLGPRPVRLSTSPPAIVLRSATNSSSLYNTGTVLNAFLGRGPGSAQDIPSSSRSSLPNLQSVNGSSTDRARSVLSSTGREKGDNSEHSQENDADECTVCMWAKVNSALYKCGHSCMCYDCAMQTYRSSGLCPLCRASIVDVLKIFKA